MPAYIKYLCFIQNIQYVTKEETWSFHK